MVYNVPGLPTRWKRPSLVSNFFPANWVRLRLQVQGRRRICMLLFKISMLRRLIKDVDYAARWRRMVHRKSYRLPALPTREKYVLHKILLQLEPRYGRLLQLKDGETFRDGFREKQCVLSVDCSAGLPVVACYSKKGLRVRYFLH